MIRKTLNLNIPRLLDSTHKVAAIKAIRTLTGLGLRESKDLVDEVGMVTIRTAVEAGAMTYSDHPVVSAQSRYDQAIDDLEAAGIRVTEVPNMPAPSVAPVVPGRDFRQEIRQLASDAVLAGDDVVALALMELVCRLS